MTVGLAPTDRVIIQMMVARVALRSPRPVGGRVRVSDIIDQVGYEMGLHRCDICGGDRAAHLFRARAAICWLARRLTPASLPQIGGHLGGRDHSTVLAAAAPPTCATATRPSPGSPIAFSPIFATYRRIDHGPG